MPRTPLAQIQLVCVISVWFCLSGCQEEPVDEHSYSLPAETPSVILDVTTGRCDDVGNDNGIVLFVVRNPNCVSNNLEPVTIVEHTASTITRYSIPLTVGSTQRVDFGYAGSREVTLFEKGSWREIPNPQSWQARDGAGLLVKEGHAYLLGGWLHGPLTNEVWKSDNLVDWEFIGFAPWSPRHGAAWLVHGNRLYVIGGEMKSDVWSSEDGLTWRQEAAAAPFGKRYTPNAASIGGKIIVYAGLRWLPNDYCDTGQLDCVVEGFNDVWESSDGGKRWERIVAAAPWEPRGLIHGSIVHDGEVFIIGGGLKVLPPGENWAETSAEFADIWSSRDGRTWVNRAASLPFPARTHFSVAETSFGCVVSDGSVGTQRNVTNNVYIAADCVNFVEVPDPPLPARHASSVAEFNGTLVILGGPPAGGAGTAIWQFIP